LIRPIAEYVLGLILLFAKDLDGTFELQQQRTWRHGKPSVSTVKRLWSLASVPSVDRSGVCYRPLG
jgi:phosphoglycerate dehydrogenase-like enzyme